MKRTSTHTRSSLSRALPAALAAATFATLVPSVALAAGGDFGAFLEDAVFQAINMALLIGIAVYAGRKAFQQYLADRKTMLSRELEEAKRLHTEAKALVTDYKAKLDAFDEERSQLLEEYEALGKSERDQIVADAEAQAAKIREDAEATVAQEIAQAKATLEAEVLSLAAEMAEDIMRERLDAKRQDALVDDYLAQLEAQAGAH